MDGSGKSKSMGKSRNKEGKKESGCWSARLDNRGTAIR
jgi:hypothetical protein